MCFHINSKFPHTAQCVKSRISNKSIDYILSIDTFQQKFVVIKFMLQSSRLEDHMNNIGIDQSLFARSSFEHICMNCVSQPSMGKSLSQLKVHLMNSITIKTHVENTRSRLVYAEVRASREHILKIFDPYLIKSDL